MGDTIRLKILNNCNPASGIAAGSLVKAFSPVVDLTETDDGVTISITDVNGTQTATVQNGESGQTGPQGPAGEAGQDGVSPTFETEQIEGGARLTITDVSGTHTVLLEDGPQGIQGETGPQGPAGQAGTDGSDGVGISGVVMNADYTLTINLTDGTSYTTESIRGPQGASGSDGANGTDGTDGADGNGIASAVLNADYTLTLTFTDGTTYTTPSIRGAQGETGAQGPAGDDYVLTSADKTEIATEAAGLVDLSGYATTSQLSTLSDEIADKYEKPATGIPASDLASGVIPDVPVTDVQVNGTSVLSSGVANIPAATAAEIKAGAVTGALIAPALQQAAAFYGLATAAGDATQAASSNAVGTYTDDALVAVQKMLGIYEAPWEVIKEGSFTNDTADTYDFTTDSNGQTFELTDVALFIETPVQSTASAIGSYGSVRFYYDSGSDFDVLMIDAWSQSANGGPRAGGCIIEQRGGMIFKTAIRAAGSGSNGLLAMRYGSGNHSFALLGSERYFYKISILSATGTINYKLYGKRRWRQ